jgi:hypothetical protein
MATDSVGQGVFVSAPLFLAISRHIYDVQRLSAELYREK